MISTGTNKNGIYCIFCNWGFNEKEYHEHVCKDGVTRSTSKHVHIGYANEFCPDCAAEGVYDTKSGTKYDQEKVRLDLIPADCIWALGEVLTHGAKKYGDNNWQKGLTLSRLAGAMLRHWFLSVMGEKNDKESGLPHTWHMFCNACFIVWMEKNKPEFDDRKKND